MRSIHGVIRDLTGNEPDGVTGTGQSEPVDTSRPGATGVVSIRIENTATVTLQGRATPHDDWKSIETVTESTAFRVALLPQMRIDYDVASGFAHAWLMESP